MITESTNMRQRLVRPALEARPHKYDLELWNSMNPPGTICDLVQNDGTLLRTKTRSVAWNLGHGQAVVLVEGKTGGWELERVRILETHKPNTNLSKRASDEGRSR